MSKKIFGSDSRVVYLLILVSCMLVGLILSNRLVARSPVASPVLQDQVDELDPESDPSSAVHYLNLLTGSRTVVQHSLKTIDENWHPGSAAMMIEIARFVPVRTTLINMFGLLELKTGQTFGSDVDAWRQWIWAQKYEPHPEYAKFKSVFYSRLDPRFGEYFEETSNPKIRLDQIIWGGVRRDGIPPLKDPIMLAAADADYLNDTDVVFGIDLNGDARCYPKRILAWHEMFKDTIGDESVCGVY